MSLFLYLEGSLGYYFETGYNFGPNSYVSVVHISPTYMRRNIHPVVGIASLNSLQFHAVNSASVYALSLKLFRV